MHPAVGGGGGQQGRGFSSDGSYGLMFQIDGALEGLGPSPDCLWSAVWPKSSVSMNR